MIDRPAVEIRLAPFEQSFFDAVPHCAEGVFPLSKLENNLLELPISCADTP